MRLSDLLARDPHTTSHQLIEAPDPVADQIKRQIADLQRRMRQHRASLAAARARKAALAVNLVLH